MPTTAERQSWKLVKETCPDLDGIMDDLVEDVNDLFDYDQRDTLRMLFAVAAEKIKDKCTKPLREALIEVIDERNTIQQDYNDLTHWYED